MSIAFFDSGIGGITVLSEALRIMPKENYLYYADTDNAPYGVKEKKDIQIFVIKAIDFLSSKNIKGLVVACNTATSVAISELRKRYKFPKNVRTNNGGFQ